MRRLRFIPVLLCVVMMGAGLRADDSIFKRLSHSLNLKGEKDLRQAEQFYQNNQYAQALSYYQKYLKKNDEDRNPDLLYRMAICYMELQQPDTGFSYAEEAYSKDRKDLDVAVLYAEYLVILGDIDTAVDTYRKIVQDHPEDYLSYVRLGELLVDQGNLKEARDFWKQAIQMNPEKPDAYARMSQSYLRVEKNQLEAYYYGRKLLDVVTGTRKESVSEMLNNIAGDLKEDFENYYQTRSCMEQARDHYEHARFQQAYDVLTGCRDISDLPGDYFLLYGKVCDEVGKFSDAAYAYERCIALGMDNGDLAYRLGWSYLNAGNKRNAEIAFKRAANYPETREKAQQMLDKIK